MAASNTAELCAIALKEYDKLKKLIDTIPEARAMVKDEDDTSIKDIIAHRAHWITLFLGWFSDGQAGKEVHFPAKGYNWGDLKRYNADLRAAQADVDWQRAKRMLEEAHADLMAFIDAQGDRGLYAGPMKGAKNNWTPGRWAEAAGPSHYRSATNFIRKRLREDV